MKVRSTASGLKRRGKPDDEIIKASKGKPEKSTGSSTLGEVPKRREQSPSLQEATLLGRCLRMEKVKRRSFERSWSSTS